MDNLGKKKKKKKKEPLNLDDLNDATNEDEVKIKSSIFFFMSHPNFEFKTCMLKEIILNMYDKFLVGY